MKKLSVLATLIAAALGSTAAMAQSQPLTREEVKADLARAMSSGELERNDQNYGTWWATSASSQNYGREHSNLNVAGSSGYDPIGSMAASSSSGTSDSTTGSGMAASTTGSGMDSASVAAGSSVDRSSQSYDSGNSGRGAAGRSYGSGTSDGVAGDSSTTIAQSGATGGTSGSTMGGASDSTGGTMGGAAGSTGGSTMGGSTTGGTSGSTMGGSMGSSQGGAMGTMGNTPGGTSTSQGSTMSAPSGTTTTYGSGSSADTTGSGTAGRRYDGSTSSGPASRADIAADRDAAMRGGRWIFNDADGVQRLEPGWNSHAGRVYQGPADAY